MRKLHHRTHSLTTERQSLQAERWWRQLIEEK
jgi:hypothetical protein